MPTGVEFFGAPVADALARIEGAPDEVRRAVLAHLAQALTSAVV